MVQFQIPNPTSTASSFTTRFVCLSMFPVKTGLFLALLANLHDVQFLPTQLRLYGLPGTHLLDFRFISKIRSCPVS